MVVVGLGGCRWGNISRGKLALHDCDRPQSDLHQTWGKEVQQLSERISEMQHDQLAMSPLSKGGVYHG